MPAKKASTPSEGPRLVIVESPAKAKTIAGYLGRGYVVESSVGHIRDLPGGAAEVPAKYKKEPWARLGVNVDEGFAPLYVVPADKKPTLRRLKDLMSDAGAVYLATDEDREGEAIAWHLLDELKPKVPVHRMVFHEITPEAINQAVSNPRQINDNLVDAQETRRILDRLYGYEVSPVLWKKVMPRLSAGRVQSVATRMVVDRERERIAFRTATYWDLVAELDAGETKDPRAVTVRLVNLDGRRVAQGRDFASDGTLKPAARDTVVHLDQAQADALKSGLAESTFAVRGVESKPYRRSPYAPFRTTTLQQEAARKLGYGAARTMQVAQRLYENGHITYMRTDSITLSETAVTAARTQVRQLFGADYLPEKPRVYQSKVKNAQEAHEAIRPSGDRFRTPAETGLRGDEFRLYELIWMRTVASQMRDAEGRSVTLRVGARTADGRDAEFTASGKVITFHGFLKAYVEGVDDATTDLDSAERRLPDVVEGDTMVATRIDADGHETKPPARYTEATLVRELEEREIGRPSTYASILGTILGRGYIYKKGQALVPTWVAFAVVRLLEEHFAHLVDYNFTASMEDALDEIARGGSDMQTWLARFYFGAPGEGTANGGGEAPGGPSGTLAGGNGGVLQADGLKALVTELGEIDAREISTFPIGDNGTGPIVIRVGRYGPYVEDAEGNRANVPEDLPPDELTLDKAKELLTQPAGLERELGTDPETGHPVVAKAGRFGPYVTEVLPEDAPKNAKPRTGSLFKSMNLDTVTFEEALRLLSLPRSLGDDPEGGEEIVALNGRYGPYVKKGTDSRSLGSEEELFTVTLEQAVELFKQPKARGRRAAAAPLRELGEDPETGKPVVVKDGRFGPYVTDGETNATLRKEDEVESISLDRAADLLAEKRAKGPAPKRAKKAAKKTVKKAAKKATAGAGAAKAAASGAKKAAAKKTTAKKTAAKKSSTAKKS
ncbi:DNA topoisomerase-1 [Actinopolymorpha cephalotaxi]|uniref:DNA topoisomerase 1 n=1 Tax=Actinopolymorpha cephalotaxi TaxID=504797 RepID=A0A1I2N0I8_9ACTN|nr:type I DNA topoisomerase [Actinopolymorpha cephalotaxi]NYH85748.1 DNA topoisomerase-1 [Actinopolymorpha cephalotaxi]SFF97272.1 DNA topoisomerase-1 [Actinopolymorpha cephalotaxi]